MEDMELKYPLPEGIEIADYFLGSTIIKCGSVWQRYDGASNAVETFKCGSVWRRYNRASNVVETVEGQWVRDEKASLVIVKKPKKGSLIIYNDEGYFVERPLAKCVIAFHAESGQRRIVPPIKTEEGFVFFKIKSYYETCLEHTAELMPQRFEDSSVAYSFEYGTAVKCGKNWRIYWKETKEVATLRETVVLGSTASDEVRLPANSEIEMKQFATRVLDAVREGIPVLNNMGGVYIFSTSTPSEGDLVKYEGEYYFVVRMLDGGIEALEVKTGMVRVIPPVKNFFGYFYTKVVTVEEASYNKQTRQINLGIIFSNLSAKK